MRDEGTADTLRCHTTMNDSPIPEPRDARSSPAHAPREIELKLLIAEEAIASLRNHALIARHIVGSVRVSRIDNRYFDTPDRLLARARMALRLRRVGMRWMQTLKVSNAGGTALSQRDEWETQLVSSGPAPRLALGRLRNTPLAALGSPRTLARKLAPVFATNFRREIRQLALSDGSQVEFAIDVGTIHSGRGKAKKSERIGEVEFELKSGDASALLRFVDRLARDVPLLPLPISKAERGYALADAIAIVPVKVELPEAKADMPARAHLSQVVAACQRALLLDVHVLYASREAAGDERIVDTEFVHQARVAVRRMRSALRMFRPVFGKRRFESINAILRAIGQVFGGVRDWDVFCDQTLDRIARTVGDDDAGKTAMHALRNEAQRQRRDAHTRLFDYLHSPRAGSDALAIERLILRVDRRGGSSLEALAPRWLDQHQRRVVDRARRIAALDEEERHGLRIDVKRLRYALDLLEALYDGGDVRRYRNALAELQSELGELNDAAVAARLMRAMGESAEIGLARERFVAWLSRRLVKRLPKVGSLSVAFELTAPPWRADGSASRNAAIDASDAMPGLRDAESDPTIASRDAVTNVATAPPHYQAVEKGGEDG